MGISNKKTWIVIVSFSALVGAVVREICWHLLDEVP